ncbi:MAG: TIGR00341 family protein [Thermodesulfobacteriota bacterium]
MVKKFLEARLKNLKINWIKTSKERRQLVVKDITSGSEPGIRFYLLLSTSALIAAFGLIANSTAVIIGAMLVSPLMTPIIGSSLGLVIGDGRLFANSLRSVVVGTVLAIFFSALLGFLPLALEATPEMLSRVRPTLLDLFVAVLAGFAGSYAMIDEKVSPALPGVAIATAIVPPLSNTGICLSLGYYGGAFGSFMLFFANFLSILLVASATFIAAGMSPAASLRKDKNFVRSFVLALMGFIVVASFLTYSLVTIVKERKLKETIETTLNEQFDKLHSTSVDSYVYDIEDGRLYILASVRSPIVMTPKDIKKLQDSFEKKIDMPIELIVRSMISNDISATGSANTIIDQNLDGFFLNKNLDADQILIRKSEQIMLEQLANWPKMRLVNTEYIDLARGPTVLATVTGFRLLTDSEIRSLENKMKLELDDENINLIVRMLKTTISDRNGEMLYGWIYYENVGPEKRKELKNLDSLTRSKFGNYPKLFVLNVHKAFEGEEINALVETVGTQPISPGDLLKIQDELSAEMDRKVNLDMWYKSEAIITTDGYKSFEEYNEKNVERVEQRLRESVDQKYW